MKFTAQSLEHFTKVISNDIISLFCGGSGTNQEIRDIVRDALRRAAKQQTRRDAVKRKVMK